MKTAAHGDAPPPASTGPISQRDIARHFGVSHVTVSLALRHSNRVSRVMGERIREHAEAIGYRRDPILSALAEYRHRKSCSVVRGAIAWINAWSHPEEVRTYPEMERYWRGGSAAAAERGYRLEEFRLGTELAPERVHQILETRSISAILLPPQLRPMAWTEFPWESYSIVGLGRCDQGPKCHQVLPGAATNVGMALRKIREKGYRRIGCMTGPSILRHAGYSMEDCLPAARKDSGEELPLLDLTGVAGTRIPATIANWIRTNHIEAVLTDDHSLGRLVERAGFSVPGEVALATLSRGKGDPFAGIDAELEEIGRTGIQMLDSFMRESPAGPQRLLRQVAIEGTWIDGDSLPRIGKPLAA
jgi:LacI family transcriptional regulator